MEELQYKAVFSFELLLSSCKIGKEGIDQEIMAALKRQEEKGMYPIKWNRETSANGGVVLKYEGAPFTNLTYKNEFVIGDNTIAFTYEERTNQQVMLPNISSYVYMLLLAIKVAEKVNGDFDKNSVKCNVKIENNTDCYFYEKYSPLAVDFSRMLKYCLKKNTGFEIELENKEDVYLLINRIYQQYKSEHSVEKPYVTVVKGSFDLMYDGL